MRATLGRTVQYLKRLREGHNRGARSQAMTPEPTTVKTCRDPIGSGNLNPSS